MYPTLKQLQILKGVYLKSWHNISSGGEYSPEKDIPEENEPVDEDNAVTNTGGGNVVDTVDKMSDD